MSKRSMGAVLATVGAPPFDDTANVFVRPGPQRIGSVYRKALYREYTDGTFSTLKPRPQEWQHLGLLGPLIRAEAPRSTSTRSTGTARR